MEQHGFILYYFRYLQDRNYDVIKSAKAIARTIRLRHEFGVDLLHAVDMEAVMRENSFFVSEVRERTVHQIVQNGLKSDLILPVL